MNKDTRLSDVLHVLLHMARADAPVTSEILARSMGTNPAVFRRTMAGLREAGIVRSDKGRGGGWQLSRPLDRITLLEVYAALGRPTLFAIGNRNEDGRCLVAQRVNAVLGETLQEAHDLFTRRFGALTLDRIDPGADLRADD